MIYLFITLITIGLCALFGLAALFYSVAESVIAALTILAIGIFVGIIFYIVGLIEPDVIHSMNEGVRSTF